MTGRPGDPAAGRLVVRVVPDVRGVDRTFDYTLSPALAAAAPGRAVRVGTILRVPLQGRRVRAWVVELNVDPPPGVALREVAAVVSAGPPPEAVELARFAAWRYAGRLRPFLLAGSPPRIVEPSALGPCPPVPAGPAGQAGGARGVSAGTAGSPAPGGLEEAVRSALGEGLGVLRLPPGSARLPVVEAVLSRPRAPGSSLLVVVPETRDATRLADGLRRAGEAVALLPGEWAAAARGAAVVVGTRDAVFAPVPSLGALVVLDAHSEALVETRAPTWRADVLAAARAARAGVPCLLVSACPTPEQASGARVVTLERTEERAGWASLVVLDRRQDDPRSGLYSPGLATLVREAARAEPARPVVCVLNRTGRARLVACGACGELSRCTACGAALAEQVGEAGASLLACPRCHLARPRICPTCGSTRAKVLRIGVARAAEELAALTGLEVAEVSGRRSTGEPAPSATVLVGTEAVLHRARAASLVVFLDFDQELLAPRLNASVQALALLALATRLVGGRRRRRPGPGRVVVQTRLPDHEVVQAARLGDPGLVLAAELERRRALELPPARAVALVSGEGLDAARAALAGCEGVETALAAPDRLLVRAPDASRLADALAGLRDQAASVRVEVDPLRL